MTGHITRNQVVHDEVERRYLPITPVHSEMPQLVRSKLTVIQRIDQDDDSTCDEYDWNHQSNPEVEYLEGSKHGCIGYSTLKPEEERGKCKKDKRGSVKKANGAYDCDGHDVFEIVRRNQFPFLLNIDLFPN